jgi:hypothetical protein
MLKPLDKTNKSLERRGKSLKLKENSNKRKLLIKPLLLREKLLQRVPKKVKSDNYLIQD